MYIHRNDGSSIAREMQAGIDYRKASSPRGVDIKLGSPVSSRCLLVLHVRGLYGSLQARTILPCHALQSLRCQANMTSQEGLQTVK